MKQFFLIYFIISISFIGFLYYKNHNLEDKKQKLLQDLVLKEVSILDLKKAIDVQNDKIQLNKINYNKRLKSFKQKNKIKYVNKYITKYITKEVNATRSNCKDVSNLLKKVREININ